MEQLILDCPSAELLATDQRWWTIYDDSFPRKEREPESVILKSLAISAGLAFRARLAGSTIGIASTHLLIQPSAVFLVYLAISRGHRGAGFGGPLMECAWSCSEARLREQGRSPLGLIWEVDIPGEASTNEENLLRQRRVDFFRRHGGVLLHSTYRQPPVNGITVPMRLMFRPATGVPPPNAGTVDALVRAIYFEKYAAVNGLSRETLADLLL